MAVRPLPPSARARGLTGRRRRARARARVLAALLAVAGLACVAFGVRADPAPAGLPAGRATPPATRTPLLSARRTPAVFVDAVATQRLRDRLGAVVAPVAGCVAVDDGARELVRINAGEPLAGGSTQKLLVAAAALSVLGPGHRFATRAVSTGTVDAESLTGDLVVVGGGDPVLTNATDATPEITRLSDLADAIVARGITRIDGALVADDSRYDRARTVPDWSPSEIAEGQAGALGALIVNGGYLDGAPAADPALDTVQELADLLTARNVEIVGDVVHSTDPAPAGAHEVARVESPTLAQIVEQMLTTSNNEAAELLTRELGFARSGTGSTAAGTQEVRAALARLGVSVAGVDLHDGSGLAPTDRVTCAALLGVVELSRRAPLTAIDRGLPIAGRSGTLVGRFAGTPLEGRLRAKTGHISGVVGLAGVIDGAATGPAIHFAFVANGSFSEAEGAQLQDEIAAAIGAFPDAPPPAELVPAPRSQA